MPHLITIQQLAADASLACRDNRLADARELLGEIYARRVFAQVAWRVYTARGNPPCLSADDLENDLWLHVQDRIGTFEPETGSFNAWLYGVARNRLIDLLRHQNRSPALTDDPASIAPETDRGIVLDDVSVREHSDLLNEPFSDQDWQQLCAWSKKNPRDPVLVIIGYGFFRKLANETDAARAAEWEFWFATCDIHEPRALFTRLDAECESDDINGRLNILRPLLNLSGNTTSQDWNRKRHLVVQLEVFWATWLSSVNKFSPEQVRAVFQRSPQDRVPVLCVDQLWHRSTNLTEWQQFQGDVRFRGIVPLLRFLQDEEFGDRLNLFAKSMYGDFDANLITLTGLFTRSVEFRQCLRI